MSYVTLHQRLRGPIRDALKQELGVKNVHALPKLTKVIVNVGINREHMEGKEQQEYIGSMLMKMTGQKCVFTKSKKAISNFKIRKGLVVGAVVTLRGKKMEVFLDRLISIILPRIRDFRGLPTKLDGHGNYNIGLRDHSVFPEVPLPENKQIFGLQILIATDAGADEPARALLKQIGVPFRPARTSSKAS